MSHPTHPQLPQFTLGDAKVQLVPHCLELAGARLFFVIDTADGRYGAVSITPDQARALATQLVIAANHAESLQRTAERRRKGQVVA